jgi:two-component system, chemotaxis family, protein-glutamate methylesterase/glutaminase
MPKNAARDIVVMGTSAGGLEALDEVITHLPADLPASIFVVQHLGMQNSGAAILNRLARHKAFRCSLARDGETFKPRGIYIAPPDQHLLIKDGRMKVTKGARENRFRPAIDPLFRSAAVSHGPSVVGVILTGLLDDGTAGLQAIQRCGGVTVVQDPKDAAYADMPQSALSNLGVDHCVPLRELGPLLDRLTRGPRGRKKAVPDDIRTEAEIAERVLSNVEEVNRLGTQVPYNCPNCGGVLWEMDQPKVGRYRCHTGHSFTPSTLLASQTERIEETLWVSLRMFEERKNLLNKMARTEVLGSSRARYAERAREADVHIERIRRLLREKPPRDGWERGKP